MSFKKFKWSQIYSGIFSLVEDQHNRNVTGDARLQAGVSTPLRETMPLGTYYGLTSLFPYKLELGERPMGSGSLQRTIL